MSSVRYPLVGGEVMRLTKLDRCGRVAWGEKATLTTEGFVSIAVTANYDDGEAVEVTNAKGKKCVQRRAKPELLNLGLTVTFCEVDPEAYTAATGFPQITDPRTGNVIGYKVDRSVGPDDVRLALEAWSDAAGSVGCEDDEDAPYGYLGWVHLTGGKVSDYTLENGDVSFVVSDLITLDGSQWDEGPYLVALDENGEPGTLAAVGEQISTYDHQIVFRTLVPPPLPTIGLVPLDNPDNGLATSAAAGTPGQWLPAGSVRPYDFTDLTDDDGDFADLAASPTTAWATGQYVTLGDGTQVHWSGTGWAEGKA